MDRHDRRRLLAALTRHYPWVAGTEWGPRAVEAGECDGCGVEPRLVATCGPGPLVFLGRRCAAEAGRAAWCDGHAEEAEAALVWLEGLPAEADTVTRVYWVATGEVTVAPALLDSSLRALSYPRP